MAQTIYATVEQFQAAVDTRTLAQLGTDSATPGLVDVNNTIIMTALKRGSADVERTALQGKRYGLSDLATLLADEDWTLIGLTIDLAISHLLGRRIGNASEDIKERVRRADETLKSLRSGDMIFRSEAAAEAGVIRPSIITPETRGRLNLVGDQPYFPRRQTGIVR
jgi:hypothetical protein